MNDNITAMDKADANVQWLITCFENGEIIESKSKDRVAILKEAEKTSKFVQKFAHEFIMKDVGVTEEHLHRVLQEHREVWRRAEEIDNIDKYPQRLDARRFPHTIVLGKKVRVLDTMENTEHLLQEYGVTVERDQIGKEVITKFPKENSTDHADAIERIISLVKLNGLSQVNTVNRIVSIAHRNPVNRVVDYLKSLNDTSHGHIQKLAEHITVENGTEHIRDKVLRMWMIMACAAADYAESTPNKEAVAKFDSAMIFVGEQGIGKTRFFKALLPKSLRSYFNDGLTIDPTNKDSIAECIQSWVVEAGEIDGLFKKVDLERFKAFLSKSFDLFRKPYERSSREHQRRTVFVGSANEREFLKDHTGNRRYWPVLVKKMIIPTNDSLIDAAWAEAWTAYTNGEVWWPQTDFKKELLSQVALFQMPISSEPIEEVIRELIGRRNDKFACDVVKPVDIRNGFRSNPLSDYAVEKIPSFTAIGKTMTQSRLGVRIRTTENTFWIIRNKEKYEKMRPIEIVRYYNDFHST